MLSVSDFVFVAPRLGLNSRQAVQSKMLCVFRLVLMPDGECLRAQRRCSCSRIQAGMLQVR